MRKLKRKTKIILIAAIALVALVIGFLGITTRFLPAPLPIWEQNKLAEAMGEEAFNESQWMDEGDRAFSYYYGKYNGYYIVSGVIQAQIITIEKIGDYSFYLNTRNIGVYKDGIYFDLDYAYEHGKISDRDLAKIYKYHMKTLKDFELEEFEEWG